MSLFFSTTRYPSDLVNLNASEASQSLPADRPKLEKVPSWIQVVLQRRVMVYTDYIKRVTDAYEKAGVGVSNFIPYDSLFSGFPELHEGLHYEFAVRVAARLRSIGKSAVYDHTQAKLNVVNICTEKGSPERIALTADLLARRQLEALYNGTKLYGDGYASSLKANVFNYIADLGPNFLEAHVTLHCVQPDLEPLYTATWQRVRELAPEILSAHADCAWKLSDRFIDVRILDRPTSTSERLKLLMGHWKNVNGAEVRNEPAA